MMSFRPNFTDVRLKGGKVSAAGESNKDDLADIIGIQIFVTQDAQDGGESAKVASGFLPQSGESWRAEFDANGLTTGPAMAVGVETHSEPMTTISWAQPVKIKKG
jgi:hypothetical protein